MSQSVRAPAALITLVETAERLRKTPSQMRWMIHSGSAPKSALIGGRRLFRSDDVEDFIAEKFADASENPRH